MNLSIIKGIIKSDMLGLLCIIILCTGLVVAPYLWENYPLPYVEELAYSLYPLIVWSKQVMQWQVPSWYHAAGLGIPWPVPHTMSHTPFMPLFAYLPVYTAVAISVMGHMMFQGWYVIALCRYFKLSRSITYVTLITILLASPMENLIPFDATAVFLGWTLLPALVYYILQLLEPEKKKSALFLAALMLGFIMGYVILNAHIGMFLPQAVMLSLLALYFLVTRDVAARFPPYRPRQERGAVD